MPTVLPERLEAPDGLLLRRWVPDDAEALERAVAESAEHLRPWMAWIADEPLPTERRRALIGEWERDWAHGGDVLLGVFVDGQRGRTPQARVRVAGRVSRCARSAGRPGDRVALADGEAAWPR